MPRNIAHLAQRQVERTVRRLQAFCATEHVYTTPESLWRAVERNKSRAVFFFSFCALVATEPEDTALAAGTAWQTRESSGKIPSRSSSLTYTKLCACGAHPNTRTRTLQVLHLFGSRTGAGCAGKDCFGWKRKI